MSTEHRQQIRPVPTGAPNGAADGAGLDTGVPPPSPPRPAPSAGTPPRVTSEVPLWTAP
ncbi:MULTISPECIES: hypothetical protein [Protofrankia]|uniref:hypothetical protein n=1 Tax=Protofrankia TaxID=2994361 RepID=UPI000A3EAA3B|nr:MULTISPECIES: hypothetical protein [Protofrankia]